MSQSVLFAVVSYSSMVEWDMTLALHTAARSLASSGVQSSIICAHGISDLCRARNGLFAAFTASGMTDMLCIDADVSWSPGTVERIIRHPVDLVFGAYPLKADGAGFAVRGFTGQEESVICVDPITGGQKEGGLVEVQGGPAGFMRITKTCADGMLKEYGNRWYEEEGTPIGKAWELFSFSFSEEEHRHWGEDLEFCRKWRAIGGKVWLDPWLMFQHHGRKVYQGCIGQHWLGIQEAAKTAPRKPDSPRVISNISRVA